jgi:hypothetical protein
VRSYRGVGGVQRKPIDALPGTIFIRLLPFFSLRSACHVPGVDLQNRSALLKIAKGLQGLSLALRHAAGATLMLTVVMLPACSDVALPSEDMPASGPDPRYNKLVADYLKSTFKNRASYDAFAISAFRWVHSFKGWAWMTCVRFGDSGHPRAYAVFIKDGKVIDSRYAVQTDACNTQTYAVFDAMGPMRAGVLGPLY